MANTLYYFLQKYYPFTGKKNVIEGLDISSTNISKKTVQDLSVGNKYYHAILYHFVV